MKCHTDSEEKPLVHFRGWQLSGSTVQHCGGVLDPGGEMLVRRCGKRAMALAQGREMHLGFFVLHPEGRGVAAASLGTEMGMQGEPSAPDGRSPGPCHPLGGRRGGEEEEEEGRVGLALEPLAGGSARSLLGREGDEGSRAALRGCWWESRTCGGWPLADD
ncbi:hypothetical protein Anapl_06237 [Anas platyrhynchos]|uniref:Uncharacterized protein n=1 Tax=Anas platyrhynchos TaxID=8839 RepID=R0L9X3_ANAPL|nr:hypothetical protein Anapl_06237 [Anas platyrhynchos]